MRGCLVVLTACAVPAEAPFERALVADVVVAAGAVSVYIENELDTACVGVARFPSPGTCHPVTDVYHCDAEPVSCVQEVSLDGVAAAQPTRPGASPYWFRGSGGSLRIRGCGHDFTTVLPSGGPHAVTTWTEDGDGLVTVQWTTDSDAPTALVGRSTVGPLCHVIGSEHRYLRETGSGDPTVEAFAPVTVVEAEIGTVRIWRSGL